MSGPKTCASANKSKLKVSIIQSIDRKVALDDIAVAKGIEFDELLDEVEAIVYSGTKINIDYFLNDVMDEERIEDIYLYFKESDTDGALHSFHRSVVSVLKDGRIRVDRSEIAALSDLEDK